MPFSIRAVPTLQPGAKRGHGGAGSPTPLFETYLLTAIHRLILRPAHPSQTSVCHLIPAGYNATPKRKTMNRPGRNRIDKVQSPVNPAEKVNVWLLEERLQFLYRHYRFVFYNVKTAVGVLQFPERIYEGIRENREGDRVDGWCYVGRPSRIRLDSGSSVLFRQGSVFTVFVSKDMDLYEWRVEQADPKDLAAPVLDQRRFGRLIWPQK